MKIAILTPSYFPELNGMTYATHAHALALLRSGHEVHVFCSKKNSAGMQEIDKEGIHIHYHEIKGSGIIWSPISGDINTLINDLKSTSPNIIITEGWHTWGTHLIPKININNSKKLIISHGSADTRIKHPIIDSIRWMGYKLYRTIYFKKILTALDGAAVLSFHKDLGRFQDYLDFEKYRIPLYKIPNSSAQKASTKIKSSTKNRSISVIGEMSPSKNQLAALDVFKKSNEIKIVNFIFQKNNKYSEKVKVKSRKIRNIRFNFYVGMSRNELSSITDDSNLIVTTSKTEAQPLIIIDALALGVPFISTNVGCLSSMEGGIVCDIKEMHNIIDNILTHEEEYAKLSKKAIDYFKKEHSEESTDKALATFLECKR